MRQSDPELCELAHSAVNLDGTAMLLRHDVIADREAEAGSLAGRLGSEERLKELVSDFRRDANAVIPDTDFDRIIEIAGRHFQGRLEFRVAALPLAPSGRLEAIAEQVEADPCDVLGTSSI
jgi:hypothetical protein